MFVSLLNIQYTPSDPFQFTYKFYVQSKYLYFDQKGINIQQRPINIVRFVGTPRFVLEMVSNLTIDKINSTPFTQVSKSSQAVYRDQGGGENVRTPILSHTDLACNTSYHFAASRTVFPRVPPYLARDRLRLLAHVYDSVASIHMTENPGRHDQS